MSRYVAMCHDDDAGWKRMDEGAAKSHWRARDDVAHVIAHAARWTGHLNIPEMQVLDLETGEVVWRGTNRWTSWRDEPRPLDRYRAQALDVHEAFPPIDHPADPWHHRDGTAPAFVAWREALDGERCEPEQLALDIASAT